MDTDFAIANWLEFSGCWTRGEVDGRLLVVGHSRTMKRSAEVQGSKDGWDTMDQTVDAPQRASAAQLAKRK